MSLEAGRKAIMGSLEAAINANGYSTEDIEWPNHKGPSQAHEARWWRISLQTGQTTPSSIGGAGQRRTLTPFILRIQLFLPEETGTKAAYDIVTQLGMGSQGMNYLQASSTDATITPNQKAVASFETWGLTPIGVTEGFAQFNLSIAGRLHTLDV